MCRYASLFVSLGTDYCLCYLRTGCFEPTLGRKVNEYYACTICVGLVEVTTYEQGVYCGEGRRSGRFGDIGGRRTLSR